MLRIRPAHPTRDVRMRSQVTDGSGRTRVSYRRERVSANWGEVQSDEPQSKDRLHNLGSSQNYNINVDHGQSSLYIDTLFTGNFLGRKSDISDGSLRYDEFRKYNNIQGDYYIAPRFLWKVAMHMTKNYLCHLMPGIKVPLVLGIWGPKGTGKTFQTELCFKKMGIEPIIMSAGELESDVAGQPGRLIRDRYRRAAEVSKVNGRMSALMINDIDAGLGRFGDTQVTVNNQIVVGSLMNICDNPTQVSIGNAWRDDEKLQRIPIIVTGNDFSTLFAPLIRDGRMDKFYWEPEFDEKVAIVHQLYKDDDIPEHDIARVIERFQHQPLDFFGALRSTMYDNQILDWIQHDVMRDQPLHENSNLKELGRRLIKKEGLPTFTAVEVTYETLCREGERLEHEQQMVLDHKLSEEYFKNLDKGPPPSGAVFTSFGG